MTTHYEYEGFEILKSYDGRWIICCHGQVFYSAHFATSDQAKRYIDQKLGL